VRKYRRYTTLCFNPDAGEGKGREGWKTGRAKTAYYFVWSGYATDYRRVIKQYIQHLSYPKCPLQSNMHTIIGLTIYGRSVLRFLADDANLWQRACCMPERITEREYEPYNDFLETLFQLSTEKINRDLIDICIIQVYTYKKTLIYNWSLRSFKPRKIRYIC